MCPMKGGCRTSCGSPSQVINHQNDPLGLQQTKAGPGPAVSYTENGSGCSHKSSFLLGTGNIRAQSQNTGTYNTPTVSTKTHQRAWNHAAKKKKRQQSTIRNREKNLIIVFMECLDCTMEIIHLIHQQMVKWKQKNVGLNC